MPFKSIHCKSVKYSVFDILVQRKMQKIHFHPFNLFAHIILFWHTWSRSLSQHALDGWQDTWRVSSPM